MIDSTFVEEIVANAQAKTVTVNGKEYTTAEVHNPPFPQYIGFPVVELRTLDSLVDYIAANRDRVEFQDAHIQADADSVELVSQPKGDYRKRDVLARSVCGVSDKNFGQFKVIEDFRIWLLTEFADTPDREVILKFIAKVSDEHVATSEDTGVSQNVTVRAGIATHTQAVVPSPVQLAPIRTFTEVDQPVGSFLFRLKQVKDQLPHAAIFELHTNWKREAAVSVKNYLDAKQEKLGEARIPVFA